MKTPSVRVLYWDIFLGGESHFTVRFLIHGRHARILGQVCDQIFGRIFDQGFWLGFRGTENTVYSSTGTEKYSFTIRRKTREKPCIKDPILLKIPYIKNLAVLPAYSLPR